MRCIIIIIIIIVIIVVVVVVVVKNSLFVQILCTEDFLDMALRKRIVANFIIVDLHTNFVLNLQRCVIVSSPHQTLHDSLQWFIT